MSVEKTTDIDVNKEPEHDSQPGQADSKADKAPGTDEKSGAPENPPEDKEPDDAVSKALKENEELKRRLEELRNDNEDVLARNQALKAELEQQEKLAKIARENEELRLQLEGVKRNSMIDHLIGRGSIPEALRGWAGKLEFRMLEEFMEHAPKPKTILQQKNDDGLSKPDQDMAKWKAEQSKSRIIS